MPRLPARVRREALKHMPLSTVLYVLLIIFVVIVILALIGVV